MKRKSIGLILLTFVVLISVGIILSETMGHVPITHDHSRSVCYGYAQGRAFGKSAGDLECDPTTTFAERIDERYFPFVADPTLAGIRVGDIVVFGQVRSFPLGHAAFVVEVPVPLVIDNIRVDQVPNEGGSEQRRVLLGAVRQAQGSPVGYHRGIGGTGVAVTFRNSFEGGFLYVGKDKFGNWRPRPSGWTGEFFQGSQLEIMAISPQQDNAGNRQRFLTWPKIASTQFTPVQWHLGNSPNPFNPSTRIIYTLPEGGSVSLVVYDVQGREVVPLVQTNREAGYYSTTWEGLNGQGGAAGSGVYFARLTVTTHTGKSLYARTIKLLLVR